MAVTNLSFLFTCFLGSLCSRNLWNFGSPSYSLLLVNVVNVCALRGKLSLPLKMNIEQAPLLNSTKTTKKETKQHKNTQEITSKNARRENTQNVCSGLVFFTKNTKKKKQQPQEMEKRGAE